MKIIEARYAVPKVIRVIPDRTADNKQGHIFAAAMHDIHLPWHRRICRQQATLHYQGKQRFWYILTLRADDVRVYMAAGYGEASAYMEQRLNRYWPKATFEESVFDTIPTHDTDVVALKYRRHNIFALDADWRADTVPVANLLAAVRDMKKGDSAICVFAFEPYDRAAWSDRSDRAYAEFRRGKMPKRPNLSAHFKPGEILRAVDDALIDLHSTVTAGLDSKEEAKRKDRERNRRPDADLDKRKLLSDGHLQPATMRKMNQPAFKAWLRVAVHSPVTMRRRVIMRTLANAFGDLTKDNELYAKPLSAASLDEINTLTLKPQTLFEPDVNIMSAEEVGKLIQVPTASLQDEYQECFESVSKREVELPRWLTAGGIPLGEVTFKGKRSTVYVQATNHDAFCAPHFAFGPMGAGKTVQGINMAIGAISAGFSAFVVDVADGEFVDKARDGLPAWLPDDHIIDLDLGHPKYAVPMNWSELAVYGCDEEELNDVGNLVASQLVRFVDTIAKAETTDRMSMYLKDAGRARLQRPDATILDAMLMLTSKKYFNTHKRYIDSPRVRNKLEAFWTAATDNERQSIIRPIQTRVSMLMDEERVSDHTMQPNTVDAARAPLVDFRKWADGDRYPYFVGIRIPKDFFLEAGTDAMATFVISKLWLAILSRYDTPKDERRPCVMVMDEPHQFPSALSLYRGMVRESRKWRLKLMWLGHTLEDFKDIIDVIRAAGCQYSQYKAKSETSLRMVLPEMAPFTKEELYAIPDRFWAVNRLSSPNGGTPAPAFLAKMSPPAARVKDRSYLRDYWAQTLGRPRTEVRQMIIDKEAQYL